ncbi:MAG: cupin domain-containing protein, partial [Chloroflexi bacterium]|nr:cupin domain-containing protein [Chloroflexota bacterium]
LFLMADEYALLCDTPLCHAEVRQVTRNEQLGAAATPPVETVLCVIDGQLTVLINGESLHLTAMQGVQIPAGHAWTAQATAHPTKVLQVDSFHPALIPEQALMEPLAHVHPFEIGADQWLVYTDYVRGGVLNFAPHFAADKHFHQNADEIFWFFQGSCRVTTADGPVLCPAGTIVYTAPDEWHIIENAGDEPLLIFLTVTPNIVPSHTFFDADGAPLVRSWAPLRGPR